MRTLFGHSADKSKNTHEIKGLMKHMATTTPPQSFDDTDVIPRSPPRSRIDSRDIPRTYSGLYGDNDDLKPLEIHRQGIFSESVPFFLISYLTLIGAIQLFTSVLFIEQHSWTITHAFHLAVTLVHVHWLKGSITDPQGELNADTLWEQLVARGENAEGARKVLLIVPTVLCYAACHNAEYEYQWCGLNLVLWLIAMFAKTPMMVGIRLFDVNRTAGIDDDYEEEEEDDGETDETPDVAGAEWKKNK